MLFFDTWLTWFHSYLTSRPSSTYLLQSVLNRRRPVINNLYDVFCAVRDDEKEHIMTMDACADGSIQTQLAEKKEALKQVEGKK